MLPAPIIEGTLPAFYLDGNGTAKIVVPFSMSRAVNRNEIFNLRLKIKNLQGSKYLKTLDAEVVDFNNYEATFSMKKEEVDKVFSMGSFYKAQLAYVDVNKVTGFYSTVGIIKYTAKPYLSISNLSISKNNTHCYTYTGVYNQQNGDPTEKAYSYRFVIKDNKEQIIVDSGYLIHNTSNDIEFYESSDTFTYNYDLDTNNKYSIYYSVKTNNGLEIEGPSYKIMQKETIEIDNIKKIFPVVNYDNGFIEVFFNVNPNPKTELEKQEADFDNTHEGYAKGRYILTRASEDFDYKNWETIVEFNLFAQKASAQTWKDFTVEQGKKYKYSIQQHSVANQLYSKRLISKAVTADFEDSFLYDGVKQLKIRFNPKVSSFKKNILESKVDTLGSKYPFIFRNGHVEYKEFPISGLISYLMDEQSFFGNNSEQFFTRERELIDIYTPYTWPTHSNKIIQENLRRNKYEKSYKSLYIFDNNTSTYIAWTDYLKEQNLTNEIDLNKYLDFSKYDVYFDSTKLYYIKNTQEVNRINLDNLKLKSQNLTSLNVSLERNFKLEVLDWLTNGKPKLFRSPTEGNFIIRLMNTSLSPEEKLGRMLHQFNATAYEIADFTYNNLKQFGFLDTQGFKNKYFKIQTIPLITKDENYQALSNIEYEYNQDEKLYYAKGSLMPLSAGQLEFIEISNVAPKTEFEINGEKIQTGWQTYKVEVPITAINLPKPIKALEDEDGNFLAEQGILTVGYYTDIDDQFTYLSNIEIKEIIGKQFIGEQIAPDGSNENIINKFYDIITSPFYYYLIRSQKRMFNDCELENFNTLTQADLDKLIPIDLYKYSLDIDPYFGNLFRPAYFEDTNFYDTLYEQSLNRNSEYRTNTNLSLYNTLDFDLLADEEKTLYGFHKTSKTIIPYDENKDEEYARPLFVQEKITYIYDPLNPNKKYITDESYSLFEKMFLILSNIINDESQYSYIKKMKDLKSYYSLMPYTIEVKFNDGNSEIINLKETWYHELKDFDNIESFKISAGIFCDFTYSVQIKNYDISKNQALMNAKAVVDAYEEILSYDGMKKFEIYNSNKDYKDYLRGAKYGFDEITKYTTNNDVSIELKDSYNDAYAYYLYLLGLYLDTIKDFDKGGLN